MATKTKHYFAEQVLNKIAAGDRPYDEKLHPKEIMLVMDQVMGFLAGENFSENYVRYGKKDVNEHYIATFENIKITEGEIYSECELPSTYADFPKNQGIYEVIPTTTPNKRIFVRSSMDMRRSSNLMEGHMEGNDFCYPRGEKLIFNRKELDTIYKTLTIRLVVIDSLGMSDTAAYPVPSNKEKMFTDLVYEHFINGTVMEEDRSNDDVKLR